MARPYNVFARMHLEVDLEENFEELNARLAYRRMKDLGLHTWLNEETIFHAWHTAGDPTSTDYVLITTKRLIEVTISKQGRQAVLFTSYPLIITNTNFKQYREVSDEYPLNNGSVFQLVGWNDEQLAYGIMVRGDEIDDYLYIRRDHRSLFTDIKVEVCYADS